MNTWPEVERDYQPHAVLVHDIQMGFALDLNFFWNGTLITSKMNKQVWERSGFVAIAKSLGLEWGGEYTKYDPVHFQLNPKGFTDQDWEQMGYSPNRNYDVV